MSDTDTPARPRQLTLAAGFVIGGSTILLLSVFDSIGNLNSVDVREQVTGFVTSPTGEGLGLTVDQALAAMRVGLMIAGACSAAAVVAGIYVLQRNRAARVLLSVLALPILLTAPLTGGLVGALVAAATAMLWSGPVRDWYDGRPIRQPRPRTPAARREPESRPAPPSSPAAGPHRADAPDSGAGPDAQVPSASSLSTSTPSSAPPATHGYGQRSDARAQYPAPGWAPPGQDPAAGVPAGVPTTVKIACALTWAFAGVVAVIYAGVLVFLAVASDGVVDLVTEMPQWQQSGLSEGTILPVLWMGTLLFFGWAVSACVLAWFTWRRKNWARWLLVASAGTALVAGFFAFPIGVPHQIATVLTMAGLLSRQARAWFSGAVPGQGPGGPGGDASGSYQPGWPQAGQQAGQQPGQQPGPYPDPQGRPPVQYPGPPPGQQQPGQQQPGQQQPGQQQPGQQQPGGKPPVW